MKRLTALVFLVFGLLLSSLAVAGGGGDGGTDACEAYDWEGSTAEQAANAFVALISAGEFEQAYQSGGETLRNSRSLEDFTKDMQAVNLSQNAKVAWNTRIPALPAKKGAKFSGMLTATDGATLPVYLHLEGDAHVKLGKRNLCWDNKTTWTVLDYRSSESFLTRIQSSTGTGLDWVLMLSGLIMLIILGGMLLYYIRGLWGMPRELYLMFFTKVTEYSAYGSASVIMVMFLQNDVKMAGQSLGDTNGYLYYTVFTLSATILTIMVGSVCDTIGVKKCLLIGAVALLTSRLIMPLSANVISVTLLGFIPLAIGFAITGPVLKVGIKMFTTAKTATLGFGLFYTLMNIGFWVGANIADFFRLKYGDDGTVSILPEFLGLDLTTYQAIILIGFLINIPDFIAILLMRDGARMTETGLVLKEVNNDEENILNELRTTVTARRKTIFGEIKISVAAVLIVALTIYILISAGVHNWKIDVVPVGKYVWAVVAVATLLACGSFCYALLSQLATMMAGGGFDRAMKAVRDATQGTIEQLKENFQQKPFWIYMGMLGILVFVKLTFYIFHIMFPTYATRVLGPDFPVASIFGSLNPAMIVFLVPLISALSVKVRSYPMLILGTGISAASVFLCFMPDWLATAIGNTWFGTVVFDYWLEAPVGGQDPFVISLVVFIIIFTIGEAIWSPRLMQFSAEIAPKGKEGAYIALAMLPYFLGKAGATVIAERMTDSYFHKDMVEFPQHTMTWLVIGIMAMISPVGLVIFRKVFTRREHEALQEAMDEGKPVKSA